MELQISNISKTYANGIQALKNFEPLNPDLEDVYFCTMAGHISRNQPEVPS